MKIRTLAAALMLAGATTAFGQTVLTVSSWLPPTHALSATQKDWCDLLEKETQGAV